jgi:hypothetical protein
MAKQKQQEQEQAVETCDRWTAAHRTVAQIPEGGEATLQELVALAEEMIPEKQRDPTATESTLWDVLNTLREVNVGFSVETIVRRVKK